MTNYIKAKCTKFSAAILVLLLNAVLMLTLSGCSSSNGTFSISGTITSGGSPLSGVTVTLSGDGSGVVTTDRTGNYGFNVSNYSSYTVTPSLIGYTFTPVNQTFHINGTDATFNFSGYLGSRMATTTHTVYLKTDGTVWAWGNNSNGQLGNGTTTNSATPVQVGGLSGVTSVAAGNDYTVALRSDGTVWTWGYNGNGQLGNGTTTDSATPVQVSGLPGVIAVVAGYTHTVALGSDGTVWTWGYNSNGQLGNGTTIDSATPVQVSGLSSVIAVAAGYNHTVALININSGGTVWAWGSNSNGQLGNGTTTDSNIPVQVGGLANIMAIAAGNAFSIAIRNDLINTSVWAWGSNNNGQLGDGNTTDAATVVAVSGLFGTGAIGIAAGYDHAVAMKADGTVWAWGGNSNGQLGNGTTTGSVTPVQVSGMSGVNAVAAGQKDTIALKIDSTGWAWGYNLYGQLGDGTTTDRWTPVQVLLP